MLKKSEGPEKKVIKSGGASQTDFRTNLKKSSKVHPVRVGSCVCTVERAVVSTVESAAASTVERAAMSL